MLSLFESWEDFFYLRRCEFQLQFHFTDTVINWNEDWMCVCLQTSKSHFLPSPVIKFCWWCIIVPWAAVLFQSARRVVLIHLGINVTCKWNFNPFLNLIWCYKKQARHIVMSMRQFEYFLHNEPSYDSTLQTVKCNSSISPGWLFLRCNWHISR